MLPIHPLAHPPDCSITPPGSKSITNRALPLAAMCARRPITLTGWLDCDDTRVMIEALRAMGHFVEQGSSLLVSQGRQGCPPHGTADLFVGNSGTTMRFLAALAAISPGMTRLDGVPRMRERPIGDLLETLQALGVDAHGNNGFPPVTVRGGGWRGGEVSIRGDVSSQFLSGLLLAAPFAPAPTTFRVEGPLVSRPYIDMTVAMLRQFSLQVSEPSPNTFHIPAPQQGHIDSYAIEPDASAASYFLAAAAITGGRVEVRGLSMDSLQGDVRFVDALERMGCRIGRYPLSVEGGSLRGIDIDMNAISDTVMTLAAVALFADGPTTIRNVAHIRHKETDRIAALATELRRLGAGIDERPDGLTITPRPLHGATIETYDDHRMAMSLALVGLRIPGVVIRDPSCVSKTYPAFFTDLELLRR